MNSCVLVFFIISILLLPIECEVGHKKRLKNEPSSSKNKKPKNDRSPARKNVIPVDNGRKVRIAVIGGGINAALFTHYLHELINAEVHIYNHGMIHKIDNSSFIVHESQKYVMEMISKFNLETKDLDPIDQAVLMYNGRENPVLNFEQNDPIKPFIKSYIKPMLQKFERIYDAQQQEKSFLSPSTLLHRMSETFQRLLAISTREFIREKYYENFLYIEEVINSLLLINYGHNLESNAFAGLTSLIFSHSTGKLKRIITPLDQVVRKLLNRSDRIFNLNVSKVTYEEMSYKVFRPQVSWIGEGDKEYSCIYDYVVIATSEIDNINFSGFKTPIVVCKNHKMVFVTVTASLNEDILEKLKNPVIAIANVKDSGSIRLANKISNLKWKILADDDIGVPNEILSIFNITGGAEVEKITLWPDYSDKECAVQATFDLDTKLFYLNAIEWASSLLEMKAIGAKNVALRIKKVKDQKRVYIQ